MVPSIKGVKNDMKDRELHQHKAIDRDVSRIICRWSLEFIDLVVYQYSIGLNKVKSLLVTISCIDLFGSNNRLQYEDLSNVGIVVGLWHHFKNKLHKISSFVFYPFLNSYHPALYSHKIEQTNLLAWLTSSQFTHIHQCPH